MPLVSAPLGLRSVDLRDEAERARLDAFVQAHPDGTPFHLSAWSAAVAQGCGQRSHMLVAERADGSLAAMLPLTEMRSPLFGAALVSTGFAVGGGILTETGDAVRPLGEAAWALAERLGCPTLEIRGGRSKGRNGSATIRPISASPARWLRRTRKNWRRSRASSAPKCARAWSAIWR